MRLKAITIVILTVMIFQCQVQSFGQSLSENHSSEHQQVSAKEDGIGEIHAGSSDSTINSSALERLTYDPEIRPASKSFRAILTKGVPVTFDVNKFARSIGKLYPKTKITSPQFCSFVFGAKGSKKIVFLTDEENPNELFIDKDRDGLLSKNERVLLKDPNTWIVDIPAEYHTGSEKTKQEKFRVKVTYDPKVQIYELATAGAKVGSVNFEGKIRKVMLVDHDGNGRWLDPNDRFLVDLNLDGSLDNLTERFACSGIVQINQKIFSLQSNQQGEFFRLSPLNHTGQLQPAISLENKAAKIVQLKAHLSSSSGVHVQFDGITSAKKVPIGSYHLDSLQVDVKLNGSIRRYHFLKSETPPQKIVVKRDKETTFQLIDGLKIKSSYSILSERRKKTITINPVIRTGTGMFLYQCLSGKVCPDQEVQLQCITTKGPDTIDLSTSGFS